VSTDDVDQRIAEASVVVPPGCAITGWAALRWLGGRWFSGLARDGTKLPVTIAVGTHDVRPQPGIAVSAEGLQERLVRVVDGVPITDARYAVSFEMRYARTLESAVTVLDMAAYNDLVSAEDQSAFITPGQNGWTGVPRAREAIGWADENAWSPMETWMRMAWVRDGGFRSPLSNRPVFDRDGRHLGTPDLIDPVAGVIGEYDGDGHLLRTQRDVDLRREARFREHGLQLVTMIAPDAADPTAFIARLTAAYRAAASAPRSARAWTLELPHWWTPTHTVELRSRLTSGERERLLRHRSA